MKRSQLIKEKSKIKTRFSISCILMFSLPSWLARLKLEISCLFPVFKIFIWEISVLSCFQEICIRIYTISRYSRQKRGKQMLFWINRNQSLFLNWIHVFVQINQKNVNLLLDTHIFTDLFSKFFLDSWNFFT